MNRTRSDSIPAGGNIPTILTTLNLPALLLWLICQNTGCQDVDFARSAILRLCSEQMHGRGYTRNGDHRTADFISREWEASGIKPLGSSYCQYFPIDVNTFPGAMKIEINGRKLTPGLDYLIDPASPGLTGRFVPVTIAAADALSGKAENVLKESGGKVILADARELASGNPLKKSQWKEWIKSLCSNNPYNLTALVEITADKLTFGAASQLSAFPHIIVNTGACPDRVSSMRINIKNKFLTGYETQNMIGYVQGTVYPDSFLVFTAHYDHLGQMGKATFFPGANDNASGVAMLLNLSRHFISHPPRFSVVFILFSGEELGLLGSEYFSANPRFQLSSVKFLINLDIVGTGIEGIMVVHASEFSGQFAKLNAINENRRLVSKIKKRSKACISDHCPFFRKGVPCFFIYTLGGVAAYHDLNDRPETLPLTAFEGLMKLMIGFAEEQ